MHPVSTAALLHVRGAFQSLSLPVPALLARLDERRSQQEVEDPVAWLRNAQGALLATPMRVQVGIELMHGWYHTAEGYARYPRGLQLLQDHLCAAAKPDIVGPIGTLELDRTRGLAHVRPADALHLDGAFGQGLLQGALDAAGDLLFSDVQWLEEEQEWRIRFVDADNREQVGWALGEPEDAMVWRLRNRVRLLEQHNAYLMARAGMGTAHSSLPAQRWIDPLTGAVPESQLRDRLLTLTQAADLVPPRFCLLGFCAPQPASDELLARMGRVGQALTRRDDLLAHLGPQGMALLLVDADVATGERIAARLREQMASETALRTCVLGWEGGSVAGFMVQAKTRLMR